MWTVEGGARHACSSYAPRWGRESRPLCSAFVIIFLVGNCACSGTKPQSTDKPGLCDAANDVDLSDAGNALTAQCPVACSTDEDCLVWGRCGVLVNASGHQCVATTEGCLNSWACQHLGHCDLSADATACVISEQGCSQSEGCKEHHLCGVVDGFCGPTTSADCGCLPEQCAPEHGRCVYSTDYCKSTTDCQKYGACTGSYGGCDQSSADWCAKSDECKIHGHCGFDGRTCVARDDADCKASDDCTAPAGTSAAKCREHNGVCGPACGAAPAFMCPQDFQEFYFSRSCDLASGVCVTGCSACQPLTLGTKASESTLCLRCGDACMPPEQGCN